ncbi:pupal cuticle protein C1B-like [Neodiprion pinetum]|uniref:Pupal cuticle protein C1B n=1 Tax=Neodiprion lecontei TaxID=441921 RepID=A0A6J0C083_NEOLC|nr:pupal cuticle protein C1B [Neodiprion lecontei]XP_046476573.1 pupal cuticle protein C1B-like [Neodiprion pinetum]
MALKYFFFAACIAAVNAGLAITSTSDNTYRSHGNLAQISTQSKSIETPYSSSSKSDIRVSNPAVYASPAHFGHYASAAPSVHHYSSGPAIQHYSAPAVQHYSPAPVVEHYAHAPAAHNSPVYTSAPGPVIAKAAYHVPAPAIHYAQPTPVAQSVYAHAEPAHYAHAEPAHYAHAAPAHYAHAAPAHYAHAAPAHYAHGGQVAGHQVGVAYSPANAVAHLSYSNANDHVNYAW